MSSSDNVRSLRELEEDKRSLERELVINEDVETYYNTHHEKLIFDAICVKDEMDRLEQGSADRDRQLEKYQSLDEQIVRAYYNLDEAKTNIVKLKEEIKEIDIKIEQIIMAD